VDFVVSVSAYIAMLGVLIGIFKAWINPISISINRMEDKIDKLVANGSDLKTKIAVANTRINVIEEKMRRDLESSNKTEVTPTQRRKNSSSS